MQNINEYIDKLAKKLHPKTCTCAECKQMSKSATLLHGSPIQDLKILKGELGRFGTKIFATPNERRAIRYMGDGVGSKDFGEFRGIIHSDAHKLIDTKGSVYTVNPEDFKVDSHKGPHDWIYSVEHSVEPTNEKKYESVLKTWTDNKLISLPKKYDINNLTEKDVEELWEFQKSLIKKGFLKKHGTGNAAGVGIDLLTDAQHTYPTTPDDNVAHTVVGDGKDVVNEGTLQKRVTRYPSYLPNMKPLKKLGFEKSALSPELLARASLMASDNPKKLKQWIALTRGFLDASNRTLAGKLERIVDDDATILKTIPKN